MGAEEQVRLAVQAAGIPICGFCELSALGALLPCRAAQRLPQSACTVILGVFPYFVGDYPSRNLSRYALGEDYHRVVLELLEQAAQRLRTAFPEKRFEAFVDNSPIPEVRAAHLAGLGIIGRNGLLLTRAYGSLCFLGELVTDLPLRPDGPVTGDCGDCRRCLNACPGGALCEHAPWKRMLCRSHLTQKKGELSVWEREQIGRGGLVWGCDLCVDCCPHNQTPKRTPIAGFYQEIVHTITEDLLGELPANRAYAYRGAAVLRRNLQILQEWNIEQRG